MALPSSPNQISLQDILFEKQDSNTARTNVSLKGLSVDGTNDYQGVDITGTPNGTAPYKISEFWEWSQGPSILISGNLTNGYDAGDQYAPACSGYTDGAYGSFDAAAGGWSGAEFTYDNDEVEISLLVGNSQNFIILGFRRTDDSAGAFEDKDDWTDLNIYRNQTDNDGNPDLTLARTSASSVLTNQYLSTIIWTWGPSSSYAISSYFGTSSNNTHHIEIE